MLPSTFSYFVKHFLYFLSDITSVDSQNNRKQIVYRVQLR